MKKIFIISLLLSLALLLSSCAEVPSSESPQSSQAQPSSEAGQEVEVEAEKFSIVASTFHEYDWVMQILGDNKDSFEVKLLLDSGSDMHSYEPSVQDITKIASADLLIYNGGNSHNWVTEVIAQPTNDNFRAVNIMENLGDAVHAEVAVEGMQLDSAHAHDHDHEEDAHDHEEGGHDDEHVWLSLNNAMMICEIIGEELALIDSENAETYKTNADNYIKELSALNDEYVSAIEQAEKDTLIFADRFPFLYMMQDYDVNYYAAFQGCAAETEASFETIKFLSEKVNEYDVYNLLILDNGLIELATTVINSSENKDAMTLVLHSMQSVTREEIDAGASYLGYMQENLETLKTALSE